MTDKYTFFYESATRLCEGLDIAASTGKNLAYLHTVMPVDGMVIALYDEKQNAYRVVVRADSSGSRMAGETVPVVGPLSSRIAGFCRSGAVLRVNPAAEPVASILGARDRSAVRSCVVIPLRPEGGPVGGAFFYSCSAQGLTDEHMELLGSLSKLAGIALSNALTCMGLQERYTAAEDENRILRSRLEGSAAVIGRDRGLKRVFEMVELVAPLTCPVLIFGETGTGKELIASAIHNASGRAKQPFVKMNCGAIPANLADSELFGHEKGAFTGATQRHAGRFERADRGSLLLDEVGELPPEVQVKLLRVLQEHEFERVGGVMPIKSDARLICATNRDLNAMVRAGSFREDLFYRINVFPILVPPLRQRREDIPLLVDYFLRVNSAALGLPGVPEVRSADLEALMAYDWPGNVRELQNTVERALILGRNGQLSFDLPGTGTSAVSEAPAGEHRTFSDSMAKTITDALAQCGGKISGPGGAAELLEINPSTLRFRMKKLGIK